MKITFARLSTKNLATLAQRAINSSKSDNYKIVANHPLFLQLETEYDKYKILYGKLSYSGKGEEVAGADRKRDEPFVNLKGYLKGITSIDTMPHYQEAVDVLNVLKTHGTNLDTLSYSEETAQMTLLIEALDKEEMQEKLTLLNLLPTYTQLKEAQAAFEVLYAQQAEANADLRSLPSATAARKALEKSLRGYFDLLYIMRNVPEWSNLYNEINEMVKAAVNS
jgi:hypothetical protein